MKRREYTDKRTADTEASGISSDEIKKSRLAYKSISLDTLRSLAPSGIIVLGFESDLCQDHDRVGPWQYNIPRKCTVSYTCSDSDRTHTILYSNLVKRGFPKTHSVFSFRWYSWTTFKSFCQKRSILVKSALTNEDTFLDILLLVSEHYRKHLNCQKAEGLQPNQGPQTYSNVADLQRLHYYGKCSLKYYRLSTSLELVQDKYGPAAKVEFIANPMTARISEQHYEELLRDVHRKLSQQYSRHLNKLEEFAGPQCNEDRLDKQRVNYQVNFTSKLSKSKSMSNSNSTSVPQTNIVFRSLSN
jgi:hypothetical protein